MLKWTKLQKGQTLIEVLVALAVGVVLIGSLVVLGNSSTQRSTQSRQANEATKLAQEGLEIARYIRDIDADNSIQVAASVPLPRKWSTLYLSNLGSGSDWGLSESCGVGVGAPARCIKPTEETGLLNIFKRKLNIADDFLPGGSICGDSSSLDREDIKRVTVTVTWESPTGTQKRTAVSCLSRP